MVFNPNEPFHYNGKSINNEVGNKDKQQCFPRCSYQQEDQCVEKTMNKTVPSFLGFVKCHPIGLCEVVTKQMTQNQNIRK